MVANDATILGNARLNLTVRDGGPAFPSDGEPYGAGFSGMSLRDYFAGQALASLAGKMFEISGTGAEICHHMARASYNFADAMLAVRQEGD